ncbi:hypothetical protein ALP25_200040 [Pseudomonas syringae pv. syringae]|nr:hypothetical protein ALP25_200040 [Pseudomonas syringae pv. syringae]
MPQGASPHQIGSNLMERLDGFIDRSRQFSERADALTQGNALQSANHAPSPATSAVQARGKVGEPQVDRIVQSLGRMFDYSIETQMVVRGATQISGSANTLLKGQ